MNDIKVSIIVPTYNGEKFIKETIESCLNQSHKNIEVIIIDDKSNDNTINIVKFYKEDSRVIIIEKKENNGVLESCNLGAKNAKGKYITFLGQDDILPENHIEKFANKFNKDVSCIFCNPILIDENGIEFGKLNQDIVFEKCMKNLELNICKNNCIAVTGALVDLNKFLQVGMFDTSFKNYGEWLLWIKLIKVGQIIYCNDSRALYRRHSNNMTNSFSNSRVKVELEEYYRKCRQYGIKNLNLKTSDKINVRLYLILNKMKKIIKGMRKVNE